MASAAASAVYSPRLWPATKSGSKPPALRQAARQASPASSIAGCVLVVSASSSAGPSAIRRESGSPRTSSAVRSSAATSGRLRKAGQHADRLRTLAREDESDTHAWILNAAAAPTLL